MSTSGFSTDDQQEQIEYYCIPRKFVFDVPEKQKDNAKRTVTIKRTLEAEKHMPFIFTFPEPENYKDSYSLLVKQITAIYNQIRLLVVEDHYEDLKHALKQPKLDQPGDCLSMLRDLFNGCCEVMKANVKDGSETDDSDSVKNYEELLQKAEAKIRTLIRNEQIFRLNFEIMTQKVEDAEKALQAANQELENGKKNQEKLMREAQELTTKLWQKEEEVKKMNKEKEMPEKRQKGISNTACSVSNSVQNTVGDGKNPVPTLNQQILNVLFTDGKYASNENTSKPPSSIEGKIRSDKRHNSDRLITTERARNEKRSTFLVENTQNSNIATETSANSNSNKGQAEKLKESLAAGFKKHMTANLTKPSKTVLNASLDIMRNKSAEYSLSQSRERLNVAMPVDKKRNSQQIKTIQPQDQVRQKPPTKERKLGEYGEKEAFSYLGHKSSVQKMVSSGKYSTLSSRPISTGKSRDSPFMSRSRTVQTEQSPENRSQDSRMMNNYTSIPNAEMVNGAYYGTYSKKVPVDLKENRNQSRGTAKSSSYIKSMIAEHLIKKIGSKAV